MGRQTVSDFLVDTNEHCFICLSKVGASSASSSSSSYSSVHGLSQFLKLDMSQVFHDKEAIPSKLLDSVKRSTLKAPLCELCAKWNERIAALCRQMKKIETEVTFYLELVQGSLLRSNGDNRTDLLYQMDKGTGSNDGWTEKLRIVKALRKETMERCSHKLTINQPRVKIQNLNANQLFAKMQRIKSKSGNGATSTSKQEDAAQIKTESFVMNSDDYYYDDANHEPMEDTISQDEGEPSNAEVNQREYSHFSTLDDDLPSFQTKPASTKSQNKRRTNVAVGQSPTKVMPLTSSNEEVQKLSYDFNPKTGKFKCNNCVAEYTRKDHLKRHNESVHLKIKHKCNLCGKEFDQISNYKTHHRTVHVGVRFKCSLCGKCFTTKHNLVQHQQSAHL